MFIYKDYQGLVEFDDEAKIFHGEVIKIKDVITFQGKTINEIKKAFIDSVEDYLNFCTSLNEYPNKQDKP